MKANFKQKTQVLTIQLDPVFRDQSTRLVLITGYSGSGKNFLGSVIANFYDVNVINLDDFGFRRNHLWLTKWRLVEKEISKLKEINDKKIVLIGVSDSLFSWIKSYHKRGFKIDSVLFPFNDPFTFKEIMHNKSNDYRLSKKVSHDDDFVRFWSQKSRWRYNTVNKYISSKLHHLLINLPYPSVARSIYVSYFGLIKRGWHECNESNL